MEDEKENWEPCLICSTLLVSSAVPNVLPVIPGGLDVDEALNDNLWHMFVLRKVLQLPQEEIEKLLRRTFGLNPSSWFKICDNCCEIVNDAFLIHSQMSQLEWNLRQLRDEIGIKVGDSFEYDNPHDVKDDLVFSARNSVREFLFSQLPPPPSTVAGTNLPILPCVSTSDILTDIKEEIVEDSNFNYDNSFNLSDVIEETDFKLDTSYTFESAAPVSMANIASMIVATNLKREDTAIRMHRKKADTPMTHFCSKRQRFLCPECRCDFTNYKGMEDHRKRFHLAGAAHHKKVSCLYCKIKLVTSKALQMHLREAHQELFKFKCDLCNAKYIRGNKLKQHQESVHSSEKFHCPHCFAGFRIKNYLKKHIDQRCPQIHGVASIVNDLVPGD